LLRNKDCRTKVNSVTSHTGIQLIRETGFYYYTDF
jgi:hypothetical protein